MTDPATPPPEEEPTPQPQPARPAPPPERLPGDDPLDHWTTISEAEADE